MQHGLCVCLSVTRVSYAKAAEPIDMPFGIWLTSAQKHHIKWQNMCATWQIRLNDLWRAEIRAVTIATCHHGVSACTRSITCISIYHAYTLTTKASDNSLLEIARPRLCAEAVWVDVGWARRVLMLLLLLLRSDWLTDDGHRLHCERWLVERRLTTVINVCQHLLNPSVPARSDCIR